MKGVTVDAPLNGTHSFDFYNPDEVAFKSISPWQQKVVATAEDYDGFADSWLPVDDGDY